MLAAVASALLLSTAGAGLDDSGDGPDTLLGLLTGAAVGALVPMTVLWLAARRRDRRRPSGGSPRPRR
ncbi:hypothetical protein GCM10010485_59360 [Streptosporangium carneum]